MLALVIASTASLEPVAGFFHGVMALGGQQPTTSTGGSGGGASRCGDGLPWRVLGYFGGGARLGTRAQQCSAYGRTRAAPLVEAKTVLNLSVRVWERVEAASSAASLRLALAGATRSAKTRQRGAALARRGEAAAAAFCVPPRPTQHTYMSGSPSSYRSSPQPASPWRALVSPRRPSARVARPPRLSCSMW